MQAILWDHTHYIFNFVWKSKNVGQERAKLEKSEYLDNAKSILDEIKIIFHIFLRASVGEIIIIIVIKNGRHKL